MISKSLVTLPEGKTLDDVIGFDYSNGLTALSHIDPQFRSPNFKIFKQRLGGKLEK